LEVISEGVETKEQADYLLKDGCSQAQGYFYNRPQRPEDLVSWF